MFSTLNRSMRRRGMAFVFLPWKRSQRQIGPYHEKLKSSLLSYLYSPLWEERGKGWGQIELFYNARSALYHGLIQLGIGASDEVILQAYTCISVPNAIIATGAKPIYCDIDPGTLNIDPNKIEALITSKTKAILIQHTLGIPADINTIRDICQKHHLLLIEDCAHALGATYQGQKCGTFGDMAIFSFGRDKVISSVNGGALLIKQERLKDWETKKFKIQNPKSKVIAQNLAYIILAPLCASTYHLGIGKLLYYLCGRLHLFPIIVTKSEKKCDFHDFSYHLPNALAAIAYHELQHIDTYNHIRYHHAQAYKKALSDKVIAPIAHDGTQPIMLRTVICVSEPKKIIDAMKKKWIILGDWYQQAIAPKDADALSALYTQESCPQAEKIASQTVNLPCHPSVSWTQREYITNTISQQLQDSI